MSEGDVTVEVTGNFEGFSSDGVLFAVRRGAHVSGIEPSSGVGSAAQTVTVIGRYFGGAEMIVCKTG